MPPLRETYYNGGHFFAPELPFGSFAERSSGSAQLPNIQFVERYRYVNRELHENTPNPTFLNGRLKTPKIDFFTLISGVFFRKSRICNARFLV